MKRFSIPEQNIEPLEKKLQRIGNKCKRYGCDFHYARVGEHITDITVTWQDWEGKIHKSKVPVKYIDIEVEGKAEVNGWQFVASLEHNDTGNIISRIGSIEVPKRYYNCAPNCEHCNTLRGRKDTYIIYKAETNEFKQVGKSCLRDFTGGMSAEAVAQFESALKEAQEAHDDFTWHGDCSYTKAKDYGAYVAETIRIYGYVKRDNYAGTISTAELAWDFLDLAYDRIYNKARREYTQAMFDDALAKGWDKELTASKALTDKVFDWIITNEKDDNYFHNLKVACSEEYITRRSDGLIASAFPAYNRELEYEAERRDRELKAKDEAARSSYAGNVGDKVSFTIADVSTISSWETQWGITTVFKLIDTNGLTYTWKTSNYVSEKSIGKTCKGTVKELKEFRGVKQTEITRAKIS